MDFGLDVDGFLTWGPASGHFRSAAWADFEWEQSPGTWLRLAWAVAADIAP